MEREVRAMEPEGAGWEAAAMEPERVERDAAVMEVENSLILGDPRAPLP